MRTLWGVLVCTALTCCGAWAQEALATAGAEPIIIPVGQVRFFHGDDLIVSACLDIGEREIARVVGHAVPWRIVEPHHRARYGTVVAIHHRAHNLPPGSAGQGELHAALTVCVAVNINGLSDPPECVRHCRDLAHARRDIHEVQGMPAAPRRGVM